MGSHGRHGFDAPSQGFQVGEPQLQLDLAQEGQLLGDLVHAEDLEVGTGHGNDRGRDAHACAEIHHPRAWGQVREVGQDHQGILDELLFP